MHEKEEALLLEMERRTEKLRAQHGWSYEKAYCEVLTADPSLYDKWLAIRERGKQAGQRPVLPRRRGGA